MLAFRRAHPVLSEEHFYTDDEIRWLNPQLGSPKWADPKCKQFACRIHGDGQDILHLMFNAGTEVANFGLPPLPAGSQWCLAGTHLALGTTRLACCRHRNARGQFNLFRSVLFKRDPYGNEAEAFTANNGNLGQS